LGHLLLPEDTFIFVSNLKSTEIAAGNAGEILREEEFPEVKVDFQVSPIPISR